jgi:hypothetical protein
VGEVYIGGVRHFFIDASRKAGTLDARTPRQQFEAQKALFAARALPALSLTALSFSVFAVL